MLGLDWGELLVIIVVAVVVIGPKDMPLALRTAGRWIARVRRVSNHFKSGLESMLRLFSEQEANPRAFEAITRFLDLLDEATQQPGARPALDPLALSFQLKLLWLSRYLPHSQRCSAISFSMGGSVTYILE